MSQIIRRGPVESTLLIVGGGQVSRDLKADLSKSKKVISTTRHLEEVNESTIFLDLTSNNFPRYLYSGNFSEVIVLAGVVGEKLCLENLPRAMEVNVISTLKLLEVLHNQKIPSIFVSSSSAFAVQHDPRTWFDTSFNVYGQLKRWIELEILENFNFTTVLRPSKIITSADQRMNFWIKSIKHDGNIVIPENLRFSPISSYYFATLLESGLAYENRILNLSATENVSYYDAVVFLQKLMSRKYQGTIYKSYMNTVTFDTKEFCELAQRDAQKLCFSQTTWEKTLIWFLKKKD